MILVIALVAALGVAVLYLARGTPALASLLKGVPAQTTFIYDSAGKPIAELHGAVNRVIVPSSRLPLALKQATVAVEDKRFYSDFHGIDLSGIARAALADLKAGSTVQGASTITEQYVKNAYLGGYDGSLTLKLREAVLAWELTDRWSKGRILTAYLNTVYYGDGAYGVQAAAETYFHRSVTRLTLAESALLAGLPQDPSGYSPIYDPADALARRNVVLTDMASQGYISPAQERRALKSPLRVYHTLPADVQPAAAYFVDYVEQQLVARFGAREVFEGGLRVYTSLNSTWQSDALGVVKNTVAPLDFGFKPSAAMVAIDPATGYIRAMVGGLDFAKQQFNLASQARRQPGSAMKPFVLAAAVEKGMDPFTTYYSSQSPVIIPMGAFAAPWVVHGDGPGGPETVAQAMTISDNAVFARLSVDVGPKNTVTRRPRHGHHESAGRRALDHAGHLGRHAARDGRRLRHPGRRRHPPRAAGRRQGRGRRRQGDLAAVDQGQPRHSGRRGLDRHPGPRAGRKPRDRRHDVRLLPLPARRQDRHHREQLGRLVCRLHAAAGDQRLDGRHVRQSANERRLRRVLLRADVGAVHGGRAGRRRASRLSRRQLGLHALARSSRHRIAASQPFELTTPLHEANPDSDDHDYSRAADADPNSHDAHAHDVTRSIAGR